jgi:hypothetical protein
MSDVADGSAEGDHLMSARVDALGLIRLSWLRNAQRVTGPLAQDALRLVDKLNTGQSRPLLVDVTGITVTREARMSFATHQSTPRIALMGSSAVDRVIAAFALRTSVVPTRYFTSESAAITWLLDPDTTI